MGYSLLDVYSIELNKEKAFRWEIHLKDENGYVLEKHRVKESEADAIFKIAVENWLKHCEEHGQKRIGKVREKE